MFDIQRFAEGDGAIETPAADTNAGAESKKPAEIEPADTSDTDIQAKIDAAIAKTTAKLEADYKKRLEAAKKEQARLEKLSDDERQKAELENTRKELAAKEAELKRKEIELEMTKVLEQRGIPIGFMQYFITDDNEATLERIKTFEKAYKSAVENAVNEKLKGRAPAAGGKNIDNGANSKITGGFMDIINKNKLAL